LNRPRKEYPVCGFREPCVARGQNARIPAIGDCCEDLEDGGLRFFGVPTSLLDEFRRRLGHGDCDWGEFACYRQASKCLEAEKTVGVF
jgi:hypothetical protein